MEKCECCVYYRDGICSVPLWAGGELYQGKYANADDEACGMFRETES